VVDLRPYADASALVKLVVREPESKALRDYLVTRREPLTSRVAAVEVRRAIGRVVDDPNEDALAAVWERVDVVELDAQIADVAARIGPRDLRSLDAIHLASAMAVVDRLDAFVTYDARLADAARELGLTVIAPR